jgi:hypothetical protein
MSGRRRLFAIALLAVAIVLVFPSGAFAAEVTPEEAIEELDVARTLIDESLTLYEEGRVEDAYTAARNSYLDHFEYVEIPLRVRDEGLTLAVEEDYATLRNLIEAEAPLNQIEDVALEVRRGLDEVERTLSEPGLAAPIIAMSYAFTILFREGLEAVLVVAAILGYLEASRNNQYRGPILKGVAAAGVATVITFILATAVIQLAPLQRELIEAGTALLAVGMLFYVSFWLITRLEHRRWMEFVKAKVWTAATTGSAIALVGVGFTAVYREGFETVRVHRQRCTWVPGGGAAPGYVLRIASEAPDLPRAVDRLVSHARDDPGAGCVDERLRDGRYLDVRDPTEEREEVGCPGSSEDRSDRVRSGTQ